MPSIRIYLNNVNLTTLHHIVKILGLGVVCSGKVNRIVLLVKFSKLTEIIYFYKEGLQY